MARYEIELTNGHMRKVTGDLLSWTEDTGVYYISQKNKAGLNWDVVWSSPTREVACIIRLEE